MNIYYKTNDKVQRLNKSIDHLIELFNSSEYTYEKYCNEKNYRNNKINSYSNNKNKNNNNIDKIFESKKFGIANKISKIIE